jgi:hypothetical protein
MRLKPSTSPNSLRYWPDVTRQRGESLDSPLPPSPRDPRGRGRVLEHPLVTEGRLSKENEAMITD